jgi:hypothetical protein
MEPATAFALTYHYQFVKVVCEAIAAGRDIDLGGELLRGEPSHQVQLQILVPDDLRVSSKERAAEVAARLRWREASVMCRDRKRITWALPGAPILVDIPSILDTLQHVHPPGLPQSDRRAVEAQALTEFKAETGRLIGVDDNSRGRAFVRNWRWLEIPPSR